MTRAPGDRIETVWDASENTGPAPKDIVPGIVRVERCTACGVQCVYWADDLTHTDPWKHHFDYCDHTEEN